MLLTTNVMFEVWLFYFVRGYDNYYDSVQNPKNGLLCCPSAPVWSFKGTADETHFVFPASGAAMSVPDDPMLSASVETDVGHAVLQGVTHRGGHGHVES